MGSSAGRTTPAKRSERSTGARHPKFAKFAPQRARASPTSDIGNIGCACARQSPARCRMVHERRLHGARKSQGPCCRTAESGAGKSLEAIFGDLDAMKFRSSVEIFET
jgi:uncharacterized protein (DUF1810 family)